MTRNRLRLSISVAKALLTVGVGGGRPASAKLGSFWDAAVTTADGLNVVRPARTRFSKISATFNG